MTFRISSGVRLAQINLEALKTEAEQQPPPSHGVEPWRFDEGVKLRQLLTDLKDQDNTDAHASYKQQVTAKLNYQLDQRQEADFGLKTGVVWIGDQDQKPVHKDVLEHNSILVIMRGDYIAMVDASVKKAPNADRRFIVQTEIFAINEKNRSTDRESAPKLGDGIQVRDLSVLAKDKIYLLPAQMTPTM